MPKHYRSPASRQLSARLREGDWLGIAQILGDAQWAAAEYGGGVRGVCTQLQISTPTYYKYATLPGVAPHLETLQHQRERHDAERMIHYLSVTLGRFLRQISDGDLHVACRNVGISEALARNWMALGIKLAGTTDVWHGDCKDASQTSAR